MNLQASFLSKSSLLSHFSTSVLIVIPPKLQKVCNIITTISLKNISLKNNISFPM